MADLSAIGIALSEESMKDVLAACLRNPPPNVARHVAISLLARSSAERQAVLFAVVGTVRSPTVWARAAEGL